MPDKKQDTEAKMHKLISSRFSCDNYDPERHVSREQILALIKAASWAPSCYGDQPWRFIIFDKQKDPISWDKALSCLVDDNRNWAKTAPVLILSCSDTMFSTNGKTNRWAQYDTGSAVENLSLQAVAMGLATHQMGGYDVVKARKLFSIPERYSPMAMISVGYQSAKDSADLTPPLKTRNPIEYNFFEGKWAGFFRI